MPLPGLVRAVRQQQFDQTVGARGGVATTRRRAGTVTIRTVHHPHPPAVFVVVFGDGQQ